MLRQISSLFQASNLFKQNATLAIAANGVALRATDGQVHLLSAADFEWQNASQLKALFEAHQNLLHQQSIDVVLSNSLVRYCVLPWQAGVLHQADWQAIAAHAFRAQHGALANQWHVAVQLAGFGRAVLAAAIDQTLLDTLDQGAEQYGFKVASITPLLSLLRSQYPHDTNHWALIAEPARLLLCQFKQGDWWQVQVDVPASGQEYAQAGQLIARSLLHVKTTEQPSKVASYVAPSLTKQWQDSLASKQKMMLQGSAKTSHVAWLASLNIPNHTLNFVSNTRARAGLLSWLVLGLSLCLLVVLAWQYQQAQHTKQALLAQASTAYLQPTRSAPNPQFDAQQAMAQQTQTQLNMPWLPMLAALEKVNAQNPDIAMVQLSPNPTRGEIKIKAETNAFKNITAYLEQLRVNPMFGDAALSSQHLEQADGQLIYVFEVNLAWQR